MTALVPRRALAAFAVHVAVKVFEIAIATWHGGILK